MTGKNRILSIGGKGTGIRSRLLAVFFAAIFLFAFLSILFGVVHFRIVGQYQNLTNNMFLEFRVIDSVTRMSQAHYVLIKNIIDDVSLKEYRKTRKELENVMAALDRSLTDRESRVAYNGLKNIIRSIDDDCENSLQRAIRGDVRQGLEVFDPIRRKISYVQENSVTLILNELKNANILHERLYRTHGIILFMSMLILVLVVLGGIFFVLVFSERLTVPLVRLSHLAGRIASGDLTGEVDRELMAKNDEIGSLASSFNSMLVNLKSNISQKEITQQKLLEAYERLRGAQARLLQAEKMSSLGTLSAGVAQEISEPIALVSSNMAALQDALKAYKKVMDEGRSLVNFLKEESTERGRQRIDEFHALRSKQDVEMITRDVESFLARALEGLVRVSRIIADLKTFVRPGVKVALEVNINHIIDNAVKVCAGQFKDRVDIIKDYGKLPLVMCNRQRLEQLFINLLVNAAESIETKGTIRIATYLQDDTICIKIIDTGRGIPADDQSKIFDPFFTTKPHGVGVGLGLSIVYDIVKQHGGRILVDSRVGSGTTFTVMLPAKGIPGLSARM